MKIMHRISRSRSSRGFQMVEKREDGINGTSQDPTKVGCEMNFYMAKK
jgi:hypothetical protein